MTPVIRTTKEKLEERMSSEWRTLALALIDEKAQLCEEKQALIEGKDALAMHVRQLNERLEVLEKAVRKWKRLALLSVPALAFVVVAIVLMWVSR